jgi:Tol biopolymer transport system component
MLARFGVFLLAATFVVTPRLNAQKTPAAAQKRPLHTKASNDAKPPTPVETAISTLTAARTFEQVAISPDAKKVAWVETIHGKDGMETGKSAIFVKGLKSDEQEMRVTCADMGGTREHAWYQPRSEGSVTWSPDSTRVAFLSDGRQPDHLQLCLKDLRDGSIRRITNVRGFLDAPRWSPDGKTIAVLFIENAPRASGPLVAETAETGEIKDSFYEQRLALVDVATGKLSQVTPADMYIYEYDWAPDSQHLVATAARGNGDNNWYIAQLFTIDVATGGMKAIYKPALQIARPIWSLD